MGSEISDLPGALRRAPFALLAWVLAAVTPADLLGPTCRALVMRALVNISIAGRKAEGSDEHRAILMSLADRAKAAIEELASDPAALSREALPPPISNIDRMIVARVLYGLGDELDAQGVVSARIFTLLFDLPVYEAIAVRASAIELVLTEVLEPKRPTRHGE